MDETEAKQRATDALITRMIKALELKRVVSLPCTVYGFTESDDWFLFVMEDVNRRTGPAEYIAIHRGKGTVRFLGTLGE